MGKKCNEWVENVLLPDLFQKYQARDKQFPSIIISDKQAAYIDSITVQKTMGGGLLGGHTVFYKVGHWQGREILLSMRGHYHFLSFGMNDAEREEAAKEAEKSQFQRELDFAERVTERKNNGGNGKAWETMVKKYSSMIVSLKDDILYYETNDPDFPFVSVMRQQLQQAQKIFAILNK